MSGKKNESMALVPAPPSLSGANRNVGNKMVATHSI
jgi:hypothetical protein